jgi:hypothetical protein
MQIRNKGEIPQVDKNIYKNLQLALYLMVRN